jgi:predicted Zn-dependent peptidase
VNILNLLQKIEDFDDPEESAEEIRALLAKIKKGLRKGVDDPELRDYISNDYLDIWQEPGAIEDSPEQFIEATADLVDQLMDEEDMDEDEDDDE